MNLGRRRPWPWDRGGGPQSPPLLLAEESKLELEDRAQAAADLRVRNVLAETSREHCNVVNNLLQRAQSETAVTTTIKLYNFIAKL